MKNVLGLMLFVVFGASAQATTFVGTLHAKKVICVAAPCKALLSFTSGGHKPFGVTAKKGSEAGQFLENVRLKGRDAHIEVTIEGQIERENTIVVEKISRMEVEAPEAQGNRTAVERTVTGTIDAEKVFCKHGPCPALAVFANEKGIKYQLAVNQGSQAERFMDHLNNTMTGGKAHVKVRVTGAFDLRSKMIRASKVEEIK